MSISAVSTTAPFQPAGLEKSLRPAVRRRAPGEDVLETRPNRAEALPDAGSAPGPRTRTVSARVWSALEDLAGPNSHTVQVANELLARRSAGLSTRVLHENRNKITTEIRGVPADVRRFDHAGVVFRHYFANREQMNAALADHHLMAGPVCYAQTGGGARTYFRDLTGVFLTLPSFGPGEVGVPGRTCYVDLVLPADTGVLQIEPGIFLVPGEPKTPDWLAELVREYLAGREVPGYALESVRQIVAAGGLREPVVVAFESA